MGILFVPYSARGHVAPMLSVVAELTGRGVPVRMIAGSAYRAAIEAAGATAIEPAVEHEVRVPAGRRPGAVVDRGRLWSRRRIAWGTTAEALRAEVRRDPPRVCVFDPHLPWVRRHAARHGARGVPFWTTHARSARHLGSAVVNALPELQPGRARFGRNFHFVGPLVGGVAAPDLGVEWERLGGRVLVVSPGTVFTRSPEFFRQIVTAFAGSTWTVVLATAQLPVEALGALPDNVIAHRWIPQQQLLHRADALLTHAGINSVHEAILAGVPMVFAPRSREQRLTGATLRTLGLGVPIERWHRLRQQVEGLVVDSQVHNALHAARMRALSSDGAARAADVLQAVADDSAPVDRFRRARYR